MRFRQTRRTRGRASTCSSSCSPVHRSLAQDEQWPSREGELSRENLLEGHEGHRMRVRHWATLSASRRSSAGGASSARGWAARGEARLAAWCGCGLLSGGGRRSHPPLHSLHHHHSKDGVHTLSRPSRFLRLPFVPRYACESVNECGQEVAEVRGGSCVRSAVCLCIHCTIMNLSL